MIYLILAYLFYVAVFAVFSYLTLYHIWRFGFVGDATKRVIYGYVFLVSLIFLISLTLIIVI